MDDTALIELERRVDALERHTAAEASALRAEIAALRTSDAPLFRVLEVEPEPQLQPRPEPEPEPSFDILARSPLAPREPSRLEQVEWQRYVTGARGLALAGGIVSLLGIVLMFVLAVDRGWVTPVMGLGLCWVFLLYLLVLSLVFF
jgi:hypothetical protein